MYIFPPDLPQLARAVPLAGAGLSLPFHYRIAPMLPAGELVVTAAGRAGEAGRMLQLTVTFRASPSCTRTIPVPASCTDAEFWLSLGMVVGHALCSAAVALEEAAHATA